MEIQLPLHCITPCMVCKCGIWKRTNSQCKAPKCSFVLLLHLHNAAAVPASVPAMAPVAVPAPAPATIQHESTQAAAAVRFILLAIFLNYHFNEFTDIFMPRNYIVLCLSSHLYFLAASKKFIKTPGRYCTMSVLRLQIITNQQQTYCL